MRKGLKNRTDGHLCSEIADKSVKTGKPIVHDTLNLEKTKASLKEEGVSYARMLPGYPYPTFFATLNWRAFR